MSRVAIVLHHHHARAAALAEEALAWLERSGHEVGVPPGDGLTPALAAHEDSRLTGAGAGEGLALALSLGGDGTMLRAVDLVRPAGVPVLGVNVGHLGYLTEVEPEGMCAALDRFFAGAHGIERRMALEARVERGAGTDGASVVLAALNEAVLEKTEPGRTVRLGVSIGGAPFTTYAADGMIVATPTGSTAYNLSARGPVVSPRHRALVMTPVSPHMLFDRSLVLDPAEEVRIEVIDGRVAGLSVDGRPAGSLSEGDSVTCGAAAEDALLVTFGERDFHRILKAKFGLSDR